MDRVPAIYEDGVFKPLAPVSLPERTEVEIPLPARDSRESAGVSETRAAQQSALAAMLKEIDRLPRQENPDGFSGKDHDRVLYGGPDGPA